MTDRISRRYFVRWTVKQTFGVVSVEERHKDNGGLLLFSLKHVAVPRPVFLLQDFVINLWERLLDCSCVVSGQSQSLKGADRDYLSVILSQIQQEQVENLSLVCV